MKVIREKRDGILTNFEVLDFLRSKGAATDPTRVIAPVAPSEYKVYDFLLQGAACNQTRESIKDLVERCKEYNLAQAEVLCIANTKPDSVPLLYPIIESFEERFESAEELVEMIAQVLPPGPEVRLEEGEQENEGEPKSLDGDPHDEGALENPEGEDS